jgi:hypothetical protein
LPSLHISLTLVSHGGGPPSVGPPLLPLPPALTQVIGTSMKDASTGPLPEPPPEPLLVAPLEEPLPPELLPLEPVLSPPASLATAAV